MKRYTDRDDAAFRAVLSELLAHPAIQVLRSVPQHKGNTTYAHCAAVARRAYALAKRFRCRVDIHPKLALRNAEQHFALNGRERNVILSHMWPIPGATLPRCREAWLVCLADKLCAWQEMRRASRS